MCFMRLYIKQKPKLNAQSSEAILILEKVSIHVQQE